MPLTVEVDTSKVGAFLDSAPQKAGLAVYRAVKRATKAAATVAGRVTAKDMGLKVGDVRKRIRVKPPTYQTLSGEVRASLKRIRLIKFAARSTRRGVTYRGKQGRTRRPHAFITNISTGPGVFQRGGASRYPIQQLYGASIGRVVALHTPEILARGEEQLLAELDHQLDRSFG